MKKYLCLVLLLLIVTIGKSQSYVLDSTFNLTGKKTYNFYNNIDRSYGSLVLADEKIVIVGLSKNNTSGSFELCFARFRINGVIDSTFGTNGVTKVSMGNQGSIGGQTPVVKQDAQGRFVAINTGRSATGSSQDLMVCRLDSTGHIDTSFHTTGVLFVDMTGAGSQPDEANAFTFDASGNIYLTGATRTAGSPLDNDFAIVKVNSSGQLDPSFDTDGKKLYNPTATAEFGTGIAVQPDGKIVFGGTAGGKMFVARIDSTGAYDPTFNTVGYRVLSTIGSSSDMYCLTLDSLNRIILGGTSAATSAAIVRILPNGALDSSFNLIGSKIYMVAGLTTTVTGMALAPSGKIVFGGAILNSSTGLNFYAARLDSTGAVDLTFNTTGYVQVPVATGNVADEANNMLLLPDGRIFINGTAVVSSAVNEDIEMILLKPVTVISGLSPTEESSIRTIYPNPANDFIIVSCKKEVTIELMNIEGKILLQQQITAGATNINIRSLSKGVYFVKEKGQSHAIKVIKL